MNKLFIFLMMMSFFKTKPQQRDTITILDAPTFKNAIANDNVQLVDVRSEQEYKEGAIDNALNIDFFQQDVFEEEFTKLNKNEPLYLYCRSGNRSQKAANQLDSLGFSKIYDLKGGYMEWPYKN